jgi:hypothetical protein
MVGEKWMECAIFGAMYHVSAVVPADSFAWPTGERAVEEEQTEAHAGGLFYIDHAAGGCITRLFLPNYFNTFRESLAEDGMFAHLVGNQGNVLQLLGREPEAQRCFAEAQAFMPSGMPDVRFRPISS